MEEINEDQYVRDEFNLSESKTFSFSSIYYFYYIYLIVYILFFFYLRGKKKKIWHEFINLLIHSYLLTRSPNTLIRVHMQ